MADHAVVDYAGAWCAGWGRWLPINACEQHYVSSTCDRTRKDGAGYDRGALLYVQRTDSMTSESRRTFVPAATS